MKRGDFIYFHLDTYLSFLILFPRSFSSPSLSVRIGGIVPSLENLSHRGNRRVMSKPPAKRRAKRKAAADVDVDDAGAGNSLLASLDLSKSRTGPKSIATALLTLLPADATRQHAMAQKLTKAFPMVISELDARSIQASRASQEEGTRKPIAFRFPANDKQGEKVGSEDEMWTTIQLPEDSFLPCLKYFTGKEIVHCVSLVSKAWLAASRNPGLWETLDKTSGLTNSNKKLNMTALQNLLRRPQFANLKHFMMPQNALKLSPKSIKQLAQLCPLLELFSVGYSTGGVTGPKTKDEELIAIAETFPNLNGIHTHMWSITNKGIVSVATAMECKCVIDLAFLLFLFQCLFNSLNTYVSSSFLLSISNILNYS